MAAATSSHAKWWFVAVAISDSAPQLAGSEKFRAISYEKDGVMKYGKTNLGNIEALLNNIGGEAQMKRIISGRARVAVVDAEPWCKVTVEGRELSLVIQSASSLGLSGHEVTIGDIYEAASEFDLDFCPEGTAEQVGWDFLQAKLPKGLDGGELNFATELAQEFGPQCWWHGASQNPCWKAGSFENRADRGGVSVLLDSFVFVLK